MDETSLTPIQKFYHGKTVFITGVTGFLGKMILERLLRCCPGIGDIYLLMREKRGKTADERLEYILNTELFKLIKDDLPEMRKKIKVIYGDIEKPNFGIEEQDAETLKNNIEIVFYSAARVRWEDPLKVAANCHIVAMKTLMSLLHEFKKLQVLLYISTAYVHKEPDFTAPEYIAKKKISPEKLLDLLEWMDDDAIEVLSKCLLKGQTNSYLFTKALAENVVENERGQIPTGIVKPCVIAPSYKDPFPGWCDTLQGIQGVCLAAGKGFLRTVYCPPSMRVNIIPADVVVSTSLVTAWYTAMNRPENILVVNCVIEYEKLPLANAEIFDAAVSKRTKYPLVNIYRYPDVTLHSSKTLHHIHAFFDHYIPAVVGDILLFIFTGKTLMLRLYRKINYLCGVYMDFNEVPWLFKMDNFYMVKSHLPEEDNKIFSMDTYDINWVQYIDDVFYTGRKVLAKEDPSNLPYAKKKAKIWLCVTTFLKWFFILFFLFAVFSKLVDDEDHDQHVSVESSFLSTESTFRNVKSSP